MEESGMRQSRVKAARAALTPGQAVYVLERLVADRRISQSEVNRYAAQIGGEIRELEARLRRLQSAAGTTVAKPVARRRAPRSNGAASKAAATPAPAKKARRAPRVTAEQLESRKLQGRYLSLIRRIPAGKRAQYTKLASVKGREAAIREMKAVLAK